MIKTTYDDGSSTTAAYNTSGQMIASTDQSGQETDYRYDAQGRLVTVTFPGVYDAVNQVQTRSSLHIYVR